MNGVARTVLTAFLLLGPLAAAKAQQTQQAPFPPPFPNLLRGTPQEEAACAPDSAKFCARFEPDPLQVLFCLQRNRLQISKACQVVLRNRGV